MEAAEFSIGGRKPQACHRSVVAFIDGDVVTAFFKQQRIPVFGKLPARSSALAFVDLVYDGLHLFGIVFGRKDHRIFAEQLLFVAVYPAACNVAVCLEVYAVIRPQIVTDVALALVIRLDKREVAVCGIALVDIVIFRPVARQRYFHAVFDGRDFGLVHGHLRHSTAAAVIAAAVFVFVGTGEQRTTEGNCKHSRTRETKPFFYFTFHHPLPLYLF